MKIIMRDKNVFEFEAEPKDCKWVGTAQSFEEAKKRYLACIEESIENEIQNMFIEFNKKYYSK
jgi:hypothetical protein